MYCSRVGIYGVLQQEGQDLWCVTAGGAGFTVCYCKRGRIYGVLLQEGQDLRCVTAGGAGFTVSHD